MKCHQLKRTVSGSSLSNCLICLQAITFRWQSVSRLFVIPPQYILFSNDAEQSAIVCYKCLSKAQFSEHIDHSFHWSLKL